MHAKLFAKKSLMQGKRVLQKESESFRMFKCVMPLLVVGDEYFEYLFYLKYKYYLQPGICNITMK